MVWHTNRSLDSSWPCGVGITTGILLLVGLTFLEKYKEPLRQYSKRLSEWEVDDFEPKIKKSKDELIRQATAIL